MTAQFDFPVVATDDPRDVVSDADIIACATSSLEPVFDGAWLQPGQHVNSLQAGELDEVMHQRADAIVIRAFETSRYYIQKDSPETPGHAKVLKRFSEGFEEKFIELGAIISGRQTGRSSTNQITLFGGSGTGPSSGLGIQFAAVGKLVYDLAMKRGDLGHRIPTEWLTQQSRGPRAGVQATKS